MDWSDMSQDRDMWRGILWMLWLNLGGYIKCVNNILSQLDISLFYSKISVSEEKPCREILSFRRALPGYYAASSGSSLSTFRDR